MVVVAILYLIANKDVYSYAAQNTNFTCENEKVWKEYAQRKL